MATSSWPSSPRKLLEARYNTFVAGDVDFILESHHPETRAQVDRASIQAWSKESQWHGFEVESERVEGDKAFLRFAVRYTRGTETFTHREDAEFRKSDAKWMYFDSQFPKQESIKRDGEKTGRNDPCPCGSGKKFKKCHGAAVAA